MRIKILIVKSDCTVVETEAKTWKLAVEKVVRLADDPFYGIDSACPVFMHDVDSRRGLDRPEQHTVASISDDAARLARGEAL